jgi:hypothetical protein
MKTLKAVRDPKPLPPLREARCKLCGHDAFALLRKFEEVEGQARKPGKRTRKPSLRLVK